MLALKSACLKFLQYANDRSSIYFSDAGAVKDLIPEPANACSLRVSSPSLGLTDYSAVPLNACD